MKRTLKVIALILSVVTLLTAMCIPAFAAYNYPMSVTIYYKDEAGNSVASTFSTSINAADTNKPTWNSPTVSSYALKNDSDATVTYEGKYDCIAISAVKGSIYGRSSND